MNFSRITSSKRWKPYQREFFNQPNWKANKQGDLQAYFGVAGLQSLAVARQREAADPVDCTDEEIAFEEIRSPVGVAGEGQLKRTGQLI